MSKRWFCRTDCESMPAVVGSLPGFAGSVGALKTIDVMHGAGSKLCGADARRVVELVGMESSVSRQATSRQALQFSRTVLLESRGSVWAGVAVHFQLPSAQRGRASSANSSPGAAWRLRRDTSRTPTRCGTVVCAERGWIHADLRITNLSNKNYEE